MSSDVASYEIAGVQLVCRHCRHDRFQHRTAQLSSFGLNLFDMEIFGKIAHVYVCDRCGGLHWFMRGHRPHDTDPLPGSDVVHPEYPDAEAVAHAPSEAEPCLACGETIPADQSACPACGWSYT